MYHPEHQIPQNANSDDATTLNSILPPELLLAIFETSCKQEHSFTPSSIAAHTIAQVCTQWREIAVNSPNLWTDIFISLNTGLWPLEKVKLYLNRSQPSLLTLDIRIEFCDRAYPSFIYDEFDGLCKLIFPHLHRCKSISIVETHPRSSRFIERTIGGLNGTCLPRLERLVVRTEWN